MLKSSTALYAMVSTSKKSDKLKETPINSRFWHYGIIDIIYADNTNIEFYGFNLLLLTFVIINYLY